MMVHYIMCTCIAEQSEADLDYLMHLVETEEPRIRCVYFMVHMWILYITHNSMTGEVSVNMYQTELTK